MIWYWAVPVIASILILGAIGLSQDVFAPLADSQNPSQKSVQPETIESEKNNLDPGPSLSDVAKEFSNDVQVILQAGTLTCECTDFDVLPDAKSKKKKVNKQEITISQVQFKSNIVKETAGSSAKITIITNWVGDLTCAGLDPEGECKVRIKLDKESKSFKVGVMPNGKGGQGGKVFPENIREPGNVRPEINCGAECGGVSPFKASNKFQVEYTGQIRPSAQPKADAPFEFSGEVIIKLLQHPDGPNCGSPAPGEAFFEMKLKIDSTKGKIVNDPKSVANKKNVIDFMKSDYDNDGRINEKEVVAMDENGVYIERHSDADGVPDIFDRFEKDSTRS